MRPITNYEKHVVAYIEHRDECDSIHCLQIHDVPTLDELLDAIDNSATSLWSFSCGTDLIRHYDEKPNVRELLREWFALKE